MSTIQPNRSAWCNLGSVVVCWLLAAGAAQGAGPLSYVPKDADVVALLHVGQIMESEIFAELIKQYPKLETMYDEPFGPKTKLTLADIDRFMFMANVGEKQFVLVFHTTEDIEIGDVAVDYEDYEEEDVGGEKLYVKDDEQGICVIENRGFLMGTPATLRATLAKPGRYKMAEELDDVMREFDPDELHGALAANLKRIVADNKARLTAQDPASAAAIEKLEAAAFTLVAAEKLELELNVHCADDAAATQLKQWADALLPALVQEPNTPPVLKTLFAALQPTAADKTLSVAFELDVPVIADLLILAGKIERAAAKE